MTSSGDDGCLNGGLLELAREKACVVRVVHNMMVNSNNRNDILVDKGEHRSAFALIFGGCCKRWVSRKVALMTLL